MNASTSVSVRSTVKVPKSKKGAQRGAAPDLEDKMKITGPRIALDVSLIFILTNAAVFIDNNWDPPRPGIRCHDPSISNPKRDNTVPTRTLIWVSVFLPILIFLLYDIFIYRPRWEYIYQNIITFSIGIGLVYLTNNIVKYNLGWPRPYFLEACDPDYSKMDCASGYVIDPPCRGDALEIKWASLTFPSLHSSAAAYGVTYLFIFLCQRNSELSRSHVVNVCSIIVQCFAVTWFVFVAVSRVSDFRHHVTDVIGGSIWGFLFALLLIFRCSGIIKTQQTASQETCEEQNTSHAHTKKRR